MGAFRCRPAISPSSQLLETDFDGARKIADALGIKTLICPATLNAEARPEATARWVARFGETLAKVGARATQDGYGFAWHNHDFEFQKAADGRRRRRIFCSAAPDIGWEMDVAWVVQAAAQDPLALDREARQAHRRRARQGHRHPRAAGLLDEGGWSDVGHGIIDTAGPCGLP